MPLSNAKQSSCREVRTHDYSNRDIVSNRCNREHSRLLDQVAEGNTKNVIETGGVAKKASVGDVWIRQGGDVMRLT